MKVMTGTLYMIPCPIADTPPYDVLPQGNREIIRSLDYFIVENVRSARRFLSAAGIARSIDELLFAELNEHTRQQDIEQLIEPLLHGRSAGVISEAGVPGVADPGAAVAALAHDRGIRVVPLVGPSSILLSLMASGQNGQSFAFVGYLPVKPAERARALRALEKRAFAEGQSQIFIEAPYRNIKLLEQILSVCSPQTILTVASDITSEGEFILSRSIALWRTEPPADIGRKPTIFILGSRK